MNIGKTFRIKVDHEAAASQPYRRDYTDALIATILDRMPNSHRFYFLGRCCLNGDENQIASNLAQETYAHPGKTLLVHLSVDSMLRKHMHAVALIIDQAKQEIIYQDPYGHPLSRDLERALHEHFPDFSVASRCVALQYDATNCAPITVDILTRYAQNSLRLSPPDPIALRAGHAAILDPKLFEPLSVTAPVNLAGRTFRLQ